MPAAPQQRVSEEFRRRFGDSKPVVVRAPGRVNLIGEHTDYNDGFVLPMAIDRAVWIALRARTDRQVAVHSLDFNDSIEFSLDALRNEKHRWAEYLKGVAWALQEANLQLQGWDGVMAGDVPIGSGLSSSAATELAAARAFAAVADLPWGTTEMAKIGRRAENEWVGVSTGIMDQTIAGAGKAGHALLLDCRSLAMEHVPLPADTVVVVLDTGTRRGLMDSAYDERHAQCEAAAQFFGVKALRDVTLKDYIYRGAELDEVTRKRAQHVITENARTLEAAEAMKRGDSVSLGHLMNASHGSLCNDFEVSSKELNVIVECARAEEGCHGARMTGAGFGGCAVALVAADRAAEFVRRTGASYQRRVGRTPQLYVCQATDGAGIVSSE